MVRLSVTAFFLDTYQCTWYHNNFIFIHRRNTSLRTLNIGNNYGAREMLVKFRHGVVKQRKDNVGNPSSITVDGSVFRLNATKQDPFVFTISHESFDYLFEVDNDVLTWDISEGEWFLFLQVDFLTGKISANKTNLPVFYTDSEPQNVSPGQHWYDVVNSTMRVYEDGFWKDTLRLFIGQSKGSKLSQARVGSHFGVDPAIRPIYPVSDVFGYPMRVRRPQDRIGKMPAFLGSTTKDLTKSRTLVRLGDFLVGASASTYLHDHCLVHLLPGNKVKFSDSTDPYNRVIGMVVRPTSVGEQVDIKTFGFVKNPQWDWSDDEISRPVFSDGSGNVVTQPQDSGVHQQVGFILSRDTIFLDIKRPIILTLPRKSYAFVPGELKPSVVVSFTKDKIFRGDEFKIDFETVPTTIFAGDGVEIDFEVQPQLMFTPGTDLTFSFRTENINLFTPSADILISFGITDMFKFSGGSDIGLIDFEKYNIKSFSGDFSGTIDFNTSIVNVLSSGDPSSIIGMTVFDLDAFKPGGEEPKFTFEIGATKIFVPSEDIIFSFTAQDKNIFLGHHSGTYTFSTTARRIFGTTSFEQKLSFTAGYNVKVFTSRKLHPLITFSV